MLLVTAATAVSCSSGASSTASGLSGTVTRGPISPVCREGVPCSAPAKQVVVQFSRGDRVVGQAKTDAEGRYRIALQAGSYSVRTPRRFGASISPTQAVVRTGVVRRFDLSIDTGIR